MRISSASIYTPIVWMSIFKLGKSIIVVTKMIAITWHYV